jgi:anaerobic dimethyl sulfoxide reductase subunit B (iron-sulfur subunit)
MSKQLGFYVNIQRCVGCKTCQMACKDKYNLPVGPNLRRVIEREGGVYPNPHFYAVSLACNHCAEPGCVKACPSGALAKREKDGVVSYDYEKCVGCRRCEWVCPYGAPQWIEVDKKMKKCDFCHDYLDQGKPPACVAACPLRALDFGDIEELAKKPGAKGRIKEFADPALTKPSVIFNPLPEAEF